MDSSDKPTDQLKRIIQQLYETESLTDSLTDKAAVLLLGWGEQQLKELARPDRSQADLEDEAAKLRRTIRSINNLVERRTELSETELVEWLIRLIDIAMQIKK